MSKSELIRINADGSLDMHEVYVLADAYSLEMKNRTFNDLTKFLKIVKNVKGTIRFWMDKEKKEEFTNDNYDALKSRCYNGQLFFTAE